MLDTVDKYDDPLAFLVRRGDSPSPLVAGAGSDTIKVEARQMAGHQKEAVVSEGADGNAWRVCSDEGKHLKGHDLAPFPLGFFNSGMQGDIYNRVRAVALAQGVPLDDFEISLVNHFWFTGSFIKGTAAAHVENPDIELRIRSSADNATVSAVVAEALKRSPAVAMHTTPLTENTFALYINGRRREVIDKANSNAPDAADPYKVYASAPRPCDPDGPANLIEKTDQQEEGVAEIAPIATTNKLIRSIYGEGRAVGADGRFEGVSWLGLPGNTHYRFATDEGVTGSAPSGLALFSTAVAFCYMTQLSRYIEHMKMPINGTRLVQLNPYTVGETAKVHPIDTHLFLNGSAPEELHHKLLSFAAHTCYLHVTAIERVDPNVKIVLNGDRIE